MRRKQAGPHRGGVRIDGATIPTVILGFCAPRGAAPLFCDGTRLLALTALYVIVISPRAALLQDVRGDVFLARPSFTMPAETCFVGAGML